MASRVSILKRLFSLNIGRSNQVFGVFSADITRFIRCSSGGSGMAQTTILEIGQFGKIETSGDDLVQYEDEKSERFFPTALGLDRLLNVGRDIDRRRTGKLQPDSIQLSTWHGDRGDPGGRAGPAAGQ